MLNKHSLTFVVSGGEDDKKNVGKKVFECLDTVCVYLGDMDQGHQMCRFRMMELKIQLVSTPWGIRGNAWKQHGAVEETHCGQRDLRVNSRCATYYLSHLGKLFNLFVFHLSHLKTSKSYAASRVAVKIKW